MRQALAIACAILTLSCRQLLSSDSYSFAAGPIDAAEPADAPVAEGDTSTSDGDAWAPGCKLTHPAPPNNTEKDAGGNIELVFALRTIDLGDVPGTDGVAGYRKLGYDLDGRCTSGGDLPSCANPFPATDPGDGVGGVDDAIGKMISNTAVKFGAEIITSALINDQVNSGILPPTSIFRIRGYAGLQDDNHVEVDWYFPELALGGDAGDDAGAAEGAGPPPRWDGTDSWPIQPTTFLQPTSPGSIAGGAMLERTSIDAYVSNYRLVAKFPPGIPLRFWKFNAALFDGVVTAEIFPNTAPRRFELRRGVIAGRATRHDVFALIPLMTTNLPAGFELCSDHPLYGTIRDWMCGFPDLVSLASEGGAPGCDMLSVALGFETVPARIGATVKEPIPPSFCTPDTNPAFEKCATSGDP